MKEFAKKIPFKESLVSFSASETLYTFSNNRSFLVRKEPIETIKGHSLYDIDVAAAVFKNLEKDYGIPIVPFSVVVGLDQGNQITAFIIAERIEGKSLREADVKEQEGRKFFSSLLNYHQDIFEKGGFLICDLNQDDFFYGHTGKDSIDRIYLTDLEPFYEFIPCFEPQNRKENYILNLETLNLILSRLENLGHNIKDLRKEFLSFLERVKDSLHPADREAVKLLISQNQRHITEETEED